MRNFIKRLRYNPLRKNSRGVALVLAATSLVLMVYIASEVAIDSTIEYAVNNQEINRIKAYYAARNSVDIALLRVKIYQQATQLQLPAGFSSQLDQIWQMPFAWPIPLSAEASAIDKDDIAGTLKEALFTGEYSQDIIDEGSKIDLNDLISPSKILQEITKKQLLNIFEQKLNTDEKFRQDYQNYKFVELINRIYDWMSPSNTSANGGDKRSPFQELGEGYPPNRGFRTIDELRLVPGMTEEFFKILSPSVTIYGMKSINPNTATLPVLKSLDPSLTDDIIKEAIERREDPEKGGPFKGSDSKQCNNDFKSFVESRGAKLDSQFETIPFICDKVVNFKIIAKGRSGSGKGAVQKTIQLIVMDFQKSSKQLKSMIDAANAQNQNQNQQNPNGQNSPNSGPSSSGQNKDPLPKGRPRIVYWSEI